MSGQAQLGDVQVTPAKPRTKYEHGRSMYEHGRGEAMIWTAAGWKPLKALVQVDLQTQRITVRISSGDLQGLPYPTGRVIVVDPVAGWSGFAVVS